MSGLSGPAVQRLAEAGPPSSTAPPAPVVFHYMQTDSFTALLHKLRASLITSAYQANELLAVRQHEWSTPRTWLRKTHGVISGD